jgi:hypothetical protein
VLAAARIVDVVLRDRTFVERELRPKLDARRLSPARSRPFTDDDGVVMVAEEVCAFSFERRN